MTKERFFWIENKVLTILLTTICNQMCVMCPQHLNDDFENHDEVLLAFIHNINKIHCKEIYITGGEPFIKSNLVDEIFKNTRRQHITILTNGTFMPSESVLASGRVTLCVPLYASFDSLHTIITGGINFYNVVKNLMDISIYRIPIELRFVITKQNYQNMLDFAVFVTRNLPFVVNIAFMGVELMEQGFCNQEEIWISPQKMIPFLIQAVQYLKTFDMPVSIYNIPHCMLPEEYHELTFKSISSWKRSYFDFCSKCRYSKSCGGFFESCVDRYKEFIKEPVV